MRPVITISLNGNSYQLEQDGYEALRAYLATAEARLADNPDKAEILADLEQAIAEKCGGYLNPHKTVVTTEEVQQVIRDMGPVDGGGAAEPSGTAGASAGSGPQAGAQPGAGPRSAGAAKRLYQIREGAMLSGVCNGLAAYFNIDVTLVRLIFVVLTLFTGGIWIVVYLVMMFVIPYAETPEEHAAAHGWAFNAQELIDRAKQHYAQFKDGQQWRARWREQRRFWRAQQRQWRAQARYWRQYHRAAYSAPPPPGAAPPDRVNHAAYILGGLLFPIFAIISAALLVALVVTIVSLVATHAVFGWALPPHIPFWLAIILAIVVYQIVTGPIHWSRHAYYGSATHAWFGLWASVVWTALIVALVWAAWWHWAEVQYFFQHLSTALHNVGERLHSSGLSV
jgi:phage shock protein PspC (stress-responsive transcriptional regulator)